MENEAYPKIDAFTGLSHKLIRAACRDEFDPFMLQGEEDGVKIRACFYYAILMTPRTTLLLDNHGRGGMCDMLPEEVVAVWDTPKLLSSQGVDWETMSKPEELLSLNSVPAPAEVYDDLSEDEKFGFEGWKALKEEEQVKGVKLTDVLRADPQMLLFFHQSLCAKTADPEIANASPPAQETRRPGPR